MKRTKKSVYVGVGTSTKLNKAEQNDQTSLSDHLHKGLFKMFKNQKK